MSEPTSSAEHLPNTLPTPDRGAVGELLREALGTGTEIAAMRVVKEQAGYWVLAVELARPAPTLVLKLAGVAASLPSDFDRTTAILGMVRANTRVPVHEVLAVDVSRAKWPWRYIVTTHLPGEEWMSARERMSAEQLSSAYEQLGGAVAELHTVRLPAFGDITRSGAVEGGDSFVEALSVRAGQRIAKAKHVELFRAVLQERRALFAGVQEADLTHEDLNGHNILFAHDKQDRWKLSGILDFDSAWAGCRESDLARLDLWRGMAPGSFWKGYTGMQTVPDGYVARRPIFQLMWCLEFSATTPQHLADTARVCAELGLPPVSDFS